MKKILNVFKAVIAVMVLLISFIACDKDFTTIGTDVIGNIHFDAKDTVYSAIAYNRKLDPVQTNGLSSNLLGVYYDPIYGPSSASVVSQMSIQTQPSGDNIELESVVLLIPYFSHVNSDDPTDSDGHTNYLLDSLYGNQEATMRLSIYRNNYFLRDYDPESDFEDNQKYFSDGSASLSENISSELDSELIHVIEEFTPSSETIVLTEINEEGVEEETEFIAPAIRIVLDEEDDLQYWQELIIDKVGEPELSNANNFKNYFRGLYFKIEDTSGDGSMVMLNFSSANVTLNYTNVSDLTNTDTDVIPDIADADVDGDGNIDTGSLDTDLDGIKDSADVDQTGGDDINGDGIDDTIVPVTEGTSVLDFTGNRVNLFENNFNMSLANGDPTLGDEKLYLKGGQGSMAMIELFGIDADDDEVPDELDDFKVRAENWLINEANLVFYEDESQINTSDMIEDHKNDRLYLYDLKNNQPIIDYYYDTPSTTVPYLSIGNHLGIRTEDGDGNYKFKIRITEHITNILQKDSLNTKLGLVLSTNVNLIENADILWESGADDDIEKVPLGSVLSPKGTVLYGNNTANTGKKVKLEIYYTEPN